MEHTSFDLTQVIDCFGGRGGAAHFDLEKKTDKKLALVISSAGEKPVERLKKTIYRLKPTARIFEVKAPFGKDAIKQYREFLSEMLYKLGEPPLRHGQETAVAFRIRKILTSWYDAILIDQAENMSEYSLDLFHKDSKGPTVFLIAYGEQILDTLLANEVLLNRVHLLG